MPSIQGGGGYVPQPIQPQRQVQQAAAPQVQAAQSELAPKDSFRPTQTSRGSETAQRLTSDTTRNQIQQLIQTAQIQVPADKPQLQMMQRPAMGSALADALVQHHVPDAPQNPQAQQAAGQMQTTTTLKSREHTEDSASRNSLQSGKRVRKQDREGEFDSLEDFGGGGGMSGDQSGRDDRSDSQKKKQILTQEDKRKPPAGARPPLGANRPQAKPPGLSPFKAATGPLTPPKPPVPKPAAAKPVIQRVQPPLQQQKPVAPPKKATDEWTI